MQCIVSFYTPQYFALGKQYRPAAKEALPFLTDQANEDLQAGEELSQLHVVEDEEGQTCGSSFRQNAVFV